MGSKTQKVGGGNATPLANDFLSFLKQGLNSGVFSSGGSTGATKSRKPHGFDEIMAAANNPDFGATNTGEFSSSNQPNMVRNSVGQTSSIADAINRALSGGFSTDTTDLKSGIRADAAREKEEGTGELLSRFGINGNRYSSGAQYGVGQYIAEADDKLNQTIGQIDLAQNAEGNATSQNILNTLFSAFQQAAGIGTPQSQYIVQPGPLSTIAGFAQAGADIYRTAKGR